MEDNRTSIKKRLDDIFIEKMGYLVNRLTNDQRSKSLLSDSAGMQARDLLKLYMDANVWDGMSSFVYSLF